LAGDELLEMLTASDKGGAKLELDDANALIMAARAHWFEEGAAPAGAEAASAEKE
jgi:N utilization substance protein A